MLKNEVGRIFPRSQRGRFNHQDDAVRNVIHVLVVDPILGSRFSLVQAASQPGFVVDAIATPEEARLQVARTRYSLVIVDDQLEGMAAIDLLAELQASHPDVARVLLTSEEGIEFKRRSIAHAGLSLVLTKPYTANSLRRNLRELLSEDSSFAGWRHLPAQVEQKNPVEAAGPQDFGPPRHHEIVLRGLLAGLNSCEDETEVFELIHAELAEPLRISHWLWLDEQSERVTRVAGDWPIQDQLTLASITRDEADLFCQARRSARVTRLDLEAEGARGSGEVLAFLSLTIRSERLRTKTCVVGLERQGAPEAASLLRELQGGLERVFHRIREAERRALSARNLARRVSEELRTPVGALTHAIDRLRGEARRAGLPADWVDQVSSESERLARAVEHLEGEILSEPTRMLRATS